MKIYRVREPGEKSWYSIEASDMYDAAERYCEMEDESGKAFSDGLTYEVQDADSPKISKVRVTASVSYSAYDVEE